VTLQFCRETVGNGIVAKRGGVGLVEAIKGWLAQRKKFLALEENKKAEEKERRLPKRSGRTPETGGKNILRLVDTMRKREPHSVYQLESEMQSSRKNLKKAVKKRRVEEREVNALRHDPLDPASMRDSPKV